MRENEKVYAKTPPQALTDGNTPQAFLANYALHRH